MRDILDRLLAFDTVSSKPNMALMEYVKGLLEDVGLTVTLVPDSSGGKANLLAASARVLKKRARHNHTSARHASVTG